jgi:hypothetical protein
MEAVILVKLEGLFLYKISNKFNKTKQLIPVDWSCHLACVDYKLMRFLTT